MRCDRSSRIILEGAAAVAGFLDLPAHAREEAAQSDADSRLVVDYENAWRRHRRHGTDALGLVRAIHHTWTTVACHRYISHGQMTGQNELSSAPDISRKEKGPAVAPSPWNSNGDLDYATFQNPASAEPSGDSRSFSKARSRI